MTEVAPAAPPMSPGASLPAVLSVGVLVLQHGQLHEPHPFQHPKGGHTLQH